MSDKSPLKLSPGKHSVRFAHEAHRRATGTPDTDPKGPLLLISNSVEIEILPAKEAAWGEPVEGVQCRLEPEKARWAADEVPKLTAYVRDRGKAGFWLPNPPAVGARLQVDGHWYRWGGAVSWTGQPHSPCGQRGPFAVALSGDWRKMSGKSPLKLTPGKHSVRFTYEAYRRTKGTGGPDSNEPLLLVSNPAEIEILPAKEPAWGESVEGVQCRLRTEKVTWPLWNVGDLGKAPKFKVDVRSRSKQTYSGTQPSTGCGVHVEWDGKWYQPQRKEEQGAREVWSVRPGDDWPNLEFSLDAGGVAGNADGTDQQNAWGIKPTVGWHMIRIAVQLFDEARISVVSNPVKIEIVAPGGETVNAAPAWGEPVEGAQCRLEPEKARWAADEVPKLTAYVRDPGKSGLWLTNPPAVGARLQVDGQWYRWSGEVQWRGPAHSPCGDRGPFAFALSRDWRKWSDETQEMSAKDPLKLSHGKHTVRFAYEAYHIPMGARASDAKEPLLLVSNSVEIEILPAEEPAWGKPAEGVQCRLRAEKATWPLWDVGELGKAPKFKVELRSQADQPFFHLSSRLFADQVHIEWDGRRYKPKHGSLNSGPELSLDPGDLVRDLDFSLDHGGVWGSPDGVAENIWGIEPTAGWHTVRIAVELIAGKNLADGTTRLSVVSNPVRIQVVPAEDGAADAGPAWGEAVEGVQCRLRAKKATWPLWDVRDPGKAPKFNIDIRSLAKEAVLRSGIWSPAVHVQWDGKWHKPTMLVPISIPLPPPTHLKQGDIIRDLPFNLETRGVMKSPDGVVENHWGFRPAIGEHTVRVAFRLESGERLITLVSNPVKIRIAPPGGETANAAAAWGEPVEGVQCRLRNVKDIWPLWDVAELGKAPKFKVDLRSQAKQLSFHLLSRLVADQIHVEWDGKWYRPRFGAAKSGPLSSLNPGDVLRNLDFSLDTDGVGASLGKPDENAWGIKPSAGQHTIRIAIQLVAGGKSADGTTRISVVSNPVKIQVVPPEGETANDEPPWGEAVEGVQCRLRTDKVSWPLWDVRDRGKAPRFKVDLRSRAERSFVYDLVYGMGVHVQWDGKWYKPRWSEPVGGEPTYISPGAVLRDLDFNLEAGGVGAVSDPDGPVENTWGIEPTAGSHTIRIAVQLSVKPRISVVSNPVTIEIVAPSGEAANAAAPRSEPAWDEVVNGLQAGLATAFDRARPWKIGQNVPLRFLLRNTTNEPITLTHPRVPIFINSKNPRHPPGPQLFDPDGKQVFPASGVGGYGLPGKVVRTVAPGEVVTVTTTRLPLRPARWNGGPVNLLAYVVKPGKHRVSLSWTFSDQGGKQFGGTVTTGTLELDVQAKDTPLPMPGTAWGEYKDGIRCRLDVDKTRLAAGEPPILFVDLQNNGQRTMKQLWHYLRFNLEIDGKWTGECSPMRPTSGPLTLFTPGQEWINVPLILGDNNYCMPATSSAPTGLVAFSKLLDPGRHTIRVDIDGVVSNPVKIEVVAEEPGGAAFGPVIERAVTD